MTAAAQMTPIEAVNDTSYFYIPTANFAKFEKEIAKLSRRAEKLIGKTIRPVVYGHCKEEIATGVFIDITEVYLDAEVPVLNGWTFCARIDHSNDIGNVIRTVPNLSGSLPGRFRTAAADCQHCNVRRMRRDTYVVRNDETGEFKQIGTTCLKDFFGHDPFAVAKMAEILGYANEVARASTERGEAALADRRWVNLEDYLAHTATVVREFGWVSAAAARENTALRATRDRAFCSMAGHEGEPTAEDVALAERALEWARGLEAQEVKTDFVHNVLVIANAAYIEERSMGIAAAIVGIYHQNARRAAGVGQAAQVGDLKGLLGIFAKAGEKLKYPKIALQLDNGMPVVLAVAGANSKAPGTINVTDGGSYGNNTWYGRVDVDGRFTPSRMVTEANRPSLIALLTAMSADPAATATQYGRMTGRCCFCSKGLTDERSTAVGYGATCAKNYGLVWG